MKLHEAMARFDRKERKVLIENCLGLNVLSRPLPPLFNKLETKLNFRFGGDLRWFTDYHIDWLVGAFWMFRTNTSKDFRAQDNLPLPASDGSSKSLGRLVRGSQEDFDLILADEANVVCIEAKWYDRWRRPQFDEKVWRVIQAKDCASRAGESGGNFNLHFVLATAGNRAPLQDKGAKDLGVPIHEIELDISHRLPDPLMVSRCESKDKLKLASKGSGWRVRLAPKRKGANTLSRTGPG